LKDKILNELKKHKDKYISGEELCRKMGISRTAVWKYINAIRKDGYKILSSPRRGYSLDSKVEPFNGYEVSSRCNTKKIGKKIIFLDCIHSTNAYLKALADSGEEEGTVVIADEQTCGRGRLGRSWVSKKGKGIWMSILLRPNVAPQKIQIITLAASVAVVKALERFNIKELGIKWPNDVLLYGKKLCGILTEMSAEADRAEYLVVGIGINTSSRLEDFPHELRDKATSLVLSCNDKKIPSRNELSAAVLDELEIIYDNVVLKSMETVVEEWKQYNVTLNRDILILNFGVNIRGKAVDITKDGGLKVETEEGTKIINSGEISVRGIMGYS